MKPLIPNIIKATEIIVTQGKYNWEILKEKARIYDFNLYKTNQYLVKR